MPQAASDTNHDSAHASSTSQQPTENTWRRSFWALIVTQFQGAFSLNVLRYLLTFMVLSPAMGLDDNQRNALVSLIAGLFFVALIVFSMAGGYLADRFSKRQVTVATKLIEIVVMVVAIFALSAHQQQNLKSAVHFWQHPALLFQHFPLAFLVLFIVAVEAAIFGPSKYGLLPELLPEKWLSWGNGVIELGTFLAIISGAVAAGWLNHIFAQREPYAGVVLLGLAGVGLLSSLGIAKVPAAAPEKKFRANFVAELWEQIRLMLPDRTLWLAVIGNTYFWFLGALFLQTVLVYGSEILHLPSEKNSLLDAALALGIGGGSLLAGYLSGNKIEYGLIPIGSFGMMVMAVLIGALEHTFASAMVVLALLGVFAGFFAVPVNALIQYRPAP